MNQNVDHSSIWDKVSVVCFLNLICFGSFYLSSVFVTELSPPVNLSADQPTVLLNALAFFVGFLARPFGALWFGMRGDLRSPQRAIKESALIIMFSTCLMGILPTTPAGDDVVFVLLRCIQGLGLGGCYAAMAVYLYEAAPEGKKGRLTSWIQASVPVGYIVALLGVLLLKMIFAQEFYVQGGWRLAFLMPLSAWLCFGLLKEPDDQVSSSTGYLEWFKLCLQTVKNELPRWAPYLLLTVGVGVLAFTTANFKFYFMKVILKMDPSVVDFSSGVGTLVYIPFYYLGGYLTDRYDKFKVSWISVVMAIILLIPSFYVMELASQQMQGQVFKIIVAVAVVGVALVIAFGSMISLLCHLFPKKMRCTLFAITYSLTVSVTGGLAHAYGIQAYNYSGARYAGLFLAAGIAGVCALVSVIMYARRST